MYVIELVLVLIVGIVWLTGRILEYLAMLFIIVLPILKLVGAVQMEWFGAVTVLSALGTPFWMWLVALIPGLTMYIIEMIRER